MPPDPDDKEQFVQASENVLVSIEVLSSTTVGTDASIGPPNDGTEEGGAAGLTGQTAEGFGYSAEGYEPNSSTDSVDQGPLYSEPEPEPLSTEASEGPTRSQIIAAENEQQDIPIEPDHFGQAIPGLIVGGAIGAAKGLAEFADDIAIDAAKELAVTGGTEYVLGQLDHNSESSEPYYTESEDAGQYYDATVEEYGDAGAADEPDASGTESQAEAGEVDDAPVKEDEDQEEAPPTDPSSSSDDDDDDSDPWNMP
jgi:hypothetical protein